MRRFRWLAVVVLVLIAGAGWFFASRRPPAFAPESFPCLTSPGAGWLTAQSDRVLVRIEWSADGGKIGVGPEGGALTWKSRSEAEARALAKELVEPLTDSRTATADSDEEVALLVACETKSSFWKGASQRVPSYRPCLQFMPHPESEDPSVPLSMRVSDTWECLKQVRTERAAPADPRAATVADRMEHQAVGSGLMLGPKDTEARSFRHPVGPGDDY